MPCQDCGAPTRSKNAARCQRCYRLAMAARNRTQGRLRMIARNPMRDPAARLRVSASLRALGHGPRERGGNGRPLPAPHRMLAEALGWATELVVPTRMGRGSGHPLHYKLDIACPSRMVAVEVDGASHAPLARRAQDRRKDLFLVRRGWTVLRFSNAAVTASLSECVRTVWSTTSPSPGTTPTSPTA